MRHGKAVASDGTVGLLSRLLPRLRRAFPRARILVRLDGGFASPAVFAFLEAQPRLDYVIAMAKNAVLERYAEPAMLVARARTWRSEQTEHVYTETNEYQAGTWNHARRVVIKAEVVRLGDREPRDNPRFVVTNMRQTPRFLYEKVYCARGDAENRIKELKALQRHHAAARKLRRRSLLAKARNTHAAQRRGLPGHRGLRTPGPPARPTTSPAPAPAPAARRPASRSAPRPRDVAPRPGPRRPPSGSPAAG